MSDSKSKKTKPVESLPADEPVSELEHHVDEMMDKSLPDPQPAMATAPEIGQSGDNPAEAPPQAAAPASSPDPPPALETEPAAPGEPELAEDPETDKLVDDIVAHESDELLAVHDARIAQLSRNNPPKPSFGNRLAAFFGGWWHHPLARYGTLLVVLGGLCALGAMPTSRYYALNSAGVRSEASLTIMDNTTQLPLKNVSVELGDRSAKTNQDGLVKLSGLKLGPQSLAIKQVGFATISQTVVLGYGSNPLGEFTLDAVGMQFRFKLTDYLSGQAVKDAEISSGEANAQSDNKGGVVLTLDQIDQGSLQAKISAEGYRSEEITLTANGERMQKLSQVIVMVPDSKEVYITKQSGKYDLYKVDLDGKNKQPLLAATGLEDANISLVQNTSGDEAALVSRRDTKQNQDGFPLQALTLVDVRTGDALTLDHSERIQIIDWMGDKLIYVKVKAGTSAGNPERYQLMSYDYNSTARLQLATANNFNDVISAQGGLYFAASNNYDGGVSQFVRINPDNTGKQVLLDKTDVWNLARTSYDDLELSVLDGLFQYKIGDPCPKKIAGAAAGNNETKFYLDAPDGKHSLWTESRDGKGVLLVYNSDTGKDTTITSQSGLNYPVRWIGDRTIVYRVTMPAESADYVVSLDGGTPHKIVDLTNTIGFGKWNYR